MKILVLFLAIACTATVSLGGTTYIIRPDGTGDFPTIAEAMLVVVDGDVIELADGVFTGEFNRGIGFHEKAITIRSQSGNPESCVIDCEYQDPGFRFYEGEGPESVVMGLKILNGHGVGAGINCSYSSSPTIIGCVFEGGAGGNGGGLNSHNSSPTFTRCQFIDNAMTGGGAAAMTGSTVSFEDCVFFNNTAYLGGGVVATNSTLTIIDCVFAGQEATTSGGGIHLSSTTAWITGCTLVGGRAQEGGAIHAIDSEVTIENSIIAFGSRGLPVTCTMGENVTLTCCDVYGNTWGDWFGCIEGQQGIAGNFSADPFFCNLVNQRPLMLHSGVEDYALRLDSPCLPGNHPDGIDCGLIGAIGLGCRPPTNAVRASVSAGAFLETTWGQLKTGYR